MTKLLPSKTKYRNRHKERIKGKATRCNTIEYGDFGIQSLERGRMTSSQIESARVAISHHIKRRGKVWIRVFPHKPVTKKPAETRQGQGKGPIKYWCANIKPGTILFEVSGCNKQFARNIMRLADFKLPFKCRFVSLQ